MSSEALNQRFLFIPKSALLASAILHGLVLFSFITVKILDHFGIHLFSKPLLNTKELYQDFIQVDVVALPDQMFGEKVDTALPVVDKPAQAEEPKPVTKEPEPEKIVAPDEMVNPEVDAKKKAAAEKEKKVAEAKAKAEKQKVEQENALKKLQEEASREAALKSLAAKSGKKGRASLKGNRLSQGTGTSGMVGTPSDRWGALLRQRILENLNLYQWQKKKGIEAVVFLRIYPNGRIRERKIVKPSMDSTYNASVLQAIDASQPLPVPDEASLYEEGINLVFRPEE